MLVELFLFMRLFSPVFLSEPRSVEQMCPMRLRIGVMILVLFLSCFVQRMRGSFRLVHVPSAVRRTQWGCHVDLQEPGPVWDTRRSSGGGPGRFSGISLSVGSVPFLFFPIRFGMK